MSIYYPLFYFFYFILCSSATLLDNQHTSWNAKVNELQQAIKEQSLKTESIKLLFPGVTESKAKLQKQKQRFEFTSQALLLDVLHHQSDWSKFVYSYKIHNAFIQLYKAQSDLDLLEKDLERMAQRASQGSSFESQDLEKLAKLLNVELRKELELKSKLKDLTTM